MRRNGDTGTWQRFEYSGGGGRSSLVFVKGRRQWPAGHRTRHDGMQCSGMCRDLVAFRYGQRPVALGGVNSAFTVRVIVLVEEQEVGS